MSLTEEQFLDTEFLDDNSSLYDRMNLARHKNNSAKQLTEFSKFDSDDIDEINKLSCEHKNYVPDADCDHDRNHDHDHDQNKSIEYFDELISTKSTGSTIKYKITIKKLMVKNCTINIK